MKGRATGSRAAPCLDVEAGESVAKPLTRRLAHAGRPRRVGQAVDRGPVAEIHDRRRHEDPVADDSNRPSSSTCQRVGAKSSYASGFEAIFAQGTDALAIQEEQSLCGPADLGNGASRRKRDV
jgi:hypothetical protein